MAAVSHWWATCTLSFTQETSLLCQIHGGSAAGCPQRQEPQFGHKCPSLQLNHRHQSSFLHAVLTSWISSPTVCGSARLKKFPNLSLCFLVHSVDCIYWKPAFVSWKVSWQFLQFEDTAKKSSAEQDFHPQTAVTNLFYITNFAFIYIPWKDALFN